MRGSLTFGLIIVIVGCSCAPALAQAGGLFGPACRAGSSPMLRTELIFGTERKPLPPVTAAEWKRFVDGEIVTRFPDGFTVLEGQGEWRGARGPVSEKSHVLIVWYVSASEPEEKFDALRSIYKQRFRQESVARIDGSDCVAF